MTVADVAQVVAAVTGTFSAVGTLAAAYAALKTTRRADETSNRATKALGRTARPQVHPIVWDHPEPALAAETAHTFRFLVRNSGGEFVARDVQLEIVRADEATDLPIVLGMAEVLAPGQMTDPRPVELSWPLGKHTPELPGNDYGGDVATLSLTYSDLNGFMRWRQECGRLKSGRMGEPQDPNLTVRWDLRPLPPQEIEGPPIDVSKRRWWQLGV